MTDVEKSEPVACEDPSCQDGWSSWMGIPYYNYKSSYAGNAFYSYGGANVLFSVFSVNSMWSLLALNGIFCLLSLNSFMSVLSVVSCLEQFAKICDTFGSLSQSVFPLYYCF